MGLLRGYHFYFISLFFFIHPSPFFPPQMVRTHGTGGGGILPHSPRKSNRKERGEGGLTPTIYTANGIEFVSEDNAFWLCLVRLPTSYCKRKIKKRGKLVGREKDGLLEPELKVLRETFRWCHELWLRTLSLSTLASGVPGPRCPPFSRSSCGVNKSSYTRAPAVKLPMAFRFTARALANQPSPSPCPCPLNHTSKRTR